jgi:two-component system, NarL family, response regulator YdfI
MIRVLIKATSALVRAGLESLIRSYDGFEVVDDPADDVGSDGRIEEFEPDVVLADVGSRGGEAASELLEDRVSGVPVVLLVTGAHADAATLLRQGAKGVLPGNATGAQIAATIEAVVAGLTVIHSDEVESLLPAQSMQESAETLPEPLTPREIEVLRALAEGLVNKEIAARLGISEHTIKFHVGSILSKLGAGTRTEAVTIGIRHGLVLL